MSHNLLYKLEKALKKNNNSKDIEFHCRNFLQKYPGNIRVSTILKKVVQQQATDDILENKKRIQEYFNSDQIEKAIKLSLDMLLIYPNDAELYGALGDIHKKSNDFFQALNYYKKAFTVNNHYEKISSKLYKFLLTHKPEEFLPEWSTGFELLLTNKKYLGHTKIYMIVNQGIQYLKKNSDFEQLSRIVYTHGSFEIDINKFNEELTQTIKNKIINLSKLSLLLMCIEETLICNIEIERMLTFFRAFILLNVEDNEFVENIKILIEKLSINCFHNDYIFYISKVEKEKLDKIKSNLLLKQNDHTSNNSVKLLCLSMYENLYNFSLNSKINLDALPEKIKNLCIHNPQREKIISEKIKSFTVIKDKTSIKVKEQYETFPYPRWSYTDTYLEKTDINNYLNSLGLQFPNNNILRKDIQSLLIGGCGTGKEAAEIGELLPNLKIKAIDLSKTSLSYAIRKCEELKIKNVEFLNGDILNLEQINKKFDIVVSNGVIHHMENPILGCKKLIETLNKNGLLKLSLYSKTARKNLVIYRNKAKTLNLHDANSLRNFRNEIITDNNTNLNWMTKISDFYSLNDFKDFICHEQEHTFTIEKIKSLIKEFNLEFCGFQNINNLHEKFSNYYDTSKYLYDLDYWEEFEENNPETFKSMYQFWCQKNY